MAYVAVTSLVQTLEELVQEKPDWISDETRIMVDSLLDSLEYFQGFLENRSSKTRQQCGKAEELEREIAGAVDEVEDAIELKINKTMKRVAFSKTLLGTLVEKIGALKGEVMGCRFGKNEETMERKALRETLSPLVEKIDSVKRSVMESSFVTDEVQGGPGDPTYEEDLPTGVSLPGHSSRYVAKLNPESIVVGLEGDLMRIMNRLKGPMPAREIIPILGMGGIGKTTLAKKVYDDAEIKYRFDILIWLTVSQEYHTRNLLLRVISCISELTNEIKAETDNKLMEMIYKKLKGRRYLVVLDDIWSTDLWDLISRIFPDDNNGSRLILTSRLNDVAMHVDPDNPPHEMNLLNLDESWKLLHDKVFGVQQQICPPELEDIGKQVAQKCQGLPLALLVVGGHLSKIARTQESWKDVAKSVSKVVANESDICLGVLSLSYNYLPNYLKPCFLYMGVFPEDMEVDIEVLINLWVSEGFTRKERFKSLEEVGRDCLEDLVSRNLLMVRKRRLNGDGKTCGVHDLVRDLILRVAEKEKFLHVSRIHEATNPSTDELCVRRYSYHSYVIDDDDCRESLSSITRTVHFFYGIFHDSLLERFKLLRVLAILDSEFYYFPVEITKLVHLRYLQFNCRDDLHCSVSELYNLQTLIIHQRGDEPQTIPASIWKMKHLRHVEISRQCFIRSRDVKSGFKLENLEGLSHLSLSSCSSALFSAIPNLKRLKVFGSCENPQYLNSLSCLKELEILKFSGGKLIPGIPIKHAFPASLKMLTLIGTYLPWENMANIVTLPNLQVLKIKLEGFHGDVWRLNDEEIFNQLQFLLIDRTNLNRWELAGGDNFPKLQRLVLKGCTYLEEIPKDFGEMCTLESIEVHKCRTSAVESIKEIQEEQESMGNCLSVVIDGIEYCKAQES